MIKRIINDKPTIMGLLTPFSDREQTNVTIIRKQNNRTETVYNSKHKAEDGPFEVTVRGITGAEFEIYFDDIYQFRHLIG